MDTITAIATAPGTAGIAIVRISGPESLNIADRVFHGKRVPSKCLDRSILYGQIYNNGSILDEVLLLVFRAPHSYTREDVVEIQGHGGVACAQRILRAVLDAGARLAEPGEFTKRAFLNGRLDLIQAEAVADLVHARTERATIAALEQLEGQLSKLFRQAYATILDVLTELEASFDFPEDDIPPVEPHKLAERLDEVLGVMKSLLGTWEEGLILREGALVVISGQTNAGKSTLFNRLVGRNRAIVTDIPGTTRDAIEEHVSWNGIPIRLVDTAGIREATCIIEREGIARAQTYAQRAAVVIHMLDGSLPISDYDREVVRQRDPGQCLVIINKKDRGKVVAPTDFDSYNILECSVLYDDCLDHIKGKVLELLGMAGDTLPHAVINERHKRLLQSAIANVRSCIDLIKTEHEDMFVAAATELRGALDSLGTALGKSYSEEMLDAIFGKFCIGK